MNPQIFKPIGTEFYSHARKQEMMLCTEGNWKDWLLYKHPDGQWVSLRKATDADVAELATALSKAHHAL